jgi:hypothetical protein
VPERRPIEAQGEPTHPHLQAGLLMAGIVVLLLVLALASVYLA